MFLRVFESSWYLLDSSNHKDTKTQRNTKSTSVAGKFSVLRRFSYGTGPILRAAREPLAGQGAGCDPRTGRGLKLPLSHLRLQTRAPFAKIGAPKLRADVVGHLLQLFSRGQIVDIDFAIGCIPDPLSAPPRRSLGRSRPFSARRGIPRPRGSLSCFPSSTTSSSTNPTSVCGTQNDLKPFKMVSEMKFAPYPDRCRGCRRESPQLFGFTKSPVRSPKPKLIALSAGRTGLIARPHMNRASFATASSDPRVSRQPICRLFIRIA